jgi:hypothetical protein
MVRRPLALALALLSLPFAAGAHGLSSETERRGGAWAVRVRYDGGAPLAGAVYQVVRPGAPERTAREGRTDAQGWVEFVPDVPGRWRVRIVDATGHGLVVSVDVPREPTGPPPARPAGGR